MRIVFAIALLACSTAATAQKTPPLTGEIDKRIDEALALAKVKPVGAAKDHEWLRRVTLDLAGRIPTRGELERFETDKNAGRRIAVVDRLLSSPDYEWHLTNVLSNQLMGAKSDKDFSAYLLHAVRTNRPWKQMFRDMILADSDDKNLRHAEKFLSRRARSADEMTNDTSRLFFGVSINCAQCHDHPLVEDWKQDHYFGLKSFFSRTFSVKNGYLGERPYGEVSFKTTEGKQKKASFMFLSGTTIKDPNPPLPKKEQKKFDDQIKKLQKNKKAGRPPAPKWSARKTLVELVTRKENEHWLARNVVNRTWARLMGTGLVDPVDQAHTANPPSHPELLDALVKDFVANKWDLKRLSRAIVLSNAYGRSSRWEQSGDPPNKSLFAVAQVRVLSPQQYALSLVVAAMSPEVMPKTNSEQWAKYRERIENQARGLSSQFELPSNNFQVSVDEALYFSNSDRFHKTYLRNSKDQLLGFLLKQPKQATAIETAYRVILGRKPSVDEVAVVQSYLEARADRKEEGMRQFVWALLTSPAVRFNH